MLTGVVLEDDVNRAHAQVLVVDDDESMCDLLGAELASRGFDAAIETRPESALLSLPSRHVDVVVTDLMMQSMSGVDLCERIISARPGLPVVMLTAHGSMDVAVAALRARAFDFLTKPPDIGALVSTIDRAVRQQRFSERVGAPGALVDGAARDGAFEGIIGVSAPMRQLVELVERVAAVDAAVLIRGESGAGKELVARALHNRSRRRDRAFVALNCAAIPEHLLEAELFGHVKGAFTDARADRPGLLERARGGTIFLDEIADLHLSLQPKLLRALQEGAIRPVGSDREIEIDVRVVTATNADLVNAVEQRRFRADLFYRLDVIEITVPPLRVRGDDILVLAQFFVEEYAASMGRDVVGLTPQCAARLAAHSWPGNVRELANVIERAVALTRSSQITVEDLPGRIGAASGVSGVALPAAAEDLLSLDEVERRHIRRVIASTGGNKTLAAQILGVHRRTLYRKAWAEGPATDATTTGDRAYR